MASLEKWRAKYEVEMQANAELGRRLGVWRDAYRKELKRRESLEEELEHQRTLHGERLAALKRELDAMQAAPGWEAAVRAVHSRPERSPEGNSWPLGRSSIKCVEGEEPETSPNASTSPPASTSPGPLANGRKKPLQGVCRSRANAPCACGCEAADDSGDLASGAGQGGLVRRAANSPSAAKVVACPSPPKSDNKVSSAAQPAAAAAPAVDSEPMSRLKRALRLLEEPRPCPKSSERRGRDARPAARATPPPPPSLPVYPAATATLDIPLAEQTAADAWAAPVSNPDYQDDFEDECGSDTDGSGSGGQSSPIGARCCLAPLSLSFNGSAGTDESQGQLSPSSTLSTPPGSPPKFNPTSPVYTPSSPLAAAAAAAAAKSTWQEPHRSLSSFACGDDYSSRGGAVKAAAAHPHVQPSPFFPPDEALEGEQAPVPGETERFAQAEKSQPRQFFGASANPVWVPPPTAEGGLACEAAAAAAAAAAAPGQLEMPEPRMKELYNASMFVSSTSQSSQGSGFCSSASDGEGDVAPQQQSLVEGVWACPASLSSSSGGEIGEQVADCGIAAPSPSFCEVPDTRLRSIDTASSGMSFSSAERETLSEEVVRAPSHEAALPAFSFGLSSRSNSGNSAAALAGSPSNKGRKALGLPLAAAAAALAGPQSPFFDAFLVVGLPDDLDPFTAEGDDDRESRSGDARPARSGKSSDASTSSAREQHRSRHRHIAHVKDRLRSVSSKLLKPHGGCVNESAACASGGSTSDSSGGSPVGARALPGEVLWSYPRDVQLPCPNVADYCFPDGVHCEPLRFGSSMSALNELLYGSGGAGRGDDSFVFVFSGTAAVEDGSPAEGDSPRLYGACVVFPQLHLKESTCTQGGAEACDENGGEAAAALAAAEEAAAAAGESSLESVSFDDLDGEKEDSDEEGGEGATHDEKMHLRRQQGRRWSLDGAGEATSRERRTRTRSAPAGGGGGSGGGSSVREFATQRCYCFLSRHPLLDLHFQVLWDLLAAERVVRMQAIADAAHRCSGSLTPADVTAAVAASAGRRRQLRRRAVRQYMALRVPAPGEQVNFTIHKALSEITYTRPLSFGAALLGSGQPVGAAGKPPPAYIALERDMLEGFAPWALPLVLAQLPPPVLLRALAALLQEWQVAVVGQELGLVSATVLALAALLRPLPWLGPFIPVLPRGMGGILTAPVPYILGLKTDGSAWDAKEVAEGQVVLDLEACQLLVGGVSDDSATTPLATAAAMTKSSRASDSAPAALPGMDDLEERLAPLYAALSAAGGGSGGICGASGGGAGTQESPWSPCSSTDRSDSSPERPLQSASARQSSAVEIYAATVSNAVTALCQEAERHVEVIKGAKWSAKGGGVWVAPAGSRLEDVSWLRRRSEHVPFFQTLVGTQGFDALRRHRLLPASSPSPRSEGKPGAMPLAVTALETVETHDFSSPTHRYLQML